MFRSNQVAPYIPLRSTDGNQSRPLRTVGQCLLAPMPSLWSSASAKWLDSHRDVVKPQRQILALRSTHHWMGSLLPPSRTVRCCSQHRENGSFYFFCFYKLFSFIVLTLSFKILRVKLAAWSSWAPPARLRLAAFFFFFLAKSISVLTWPQIPGRWSTYYKCANQGSRLKLIQLNISTQNQVRV